MESALRFVQGAVARKDFVAALTHFRIVGGTILGFNGRIALSSPIDLDLDVSPKATAFIKAIQTCKETIQLHMTPNGRLAVKSGAFRAYVDCFEEEYPAIAPEGEIVELDGSLLDSLRVLYPFIAEDASREWARGILIRGPSAVATNNVVLVERWLGYHFPTEINVPKEAVQELLRIGEEPERLQVSERSVTFHFSGNRWLRAQLNSLAWPDVSRVLDSPSDPKPIPAGFFDSVHSLIPFVGSTGVVHFLDDILSTSRDADEGALVGVDGVRAGGAFHGEQLASLEGVAESADFSLYPAPCMFFGDRLRGAIVGIRV